MNILVTGGSRGIGREVVRMARERGWLVYAPTRQELDMSSVASVGNFHGRLVETPEAVVFCHGEWYSVSLEKRDDHIYPWTRQFHMRLLWPAVMMDGWLQMGGLRSVVMVASTRGFIGGVNTGPYSVACAAQIALMQGYAREWPGCRFNAVCPGWTDTRMGEEVLASEGVAPGKTPQAPEAVAQVIVDLLVGEDNGEVVEVSYGRATRAHWLRGEEPWP